MRMSKLSFNVRRWLITVWSILWIKLLSRAEASNGCGRIDMTPLASGMLMLAVCSTTLWSEKKFRVTWNCNQSSCRFTHDVATIGLPVTEKMASPARACRNIENGLAGLTFGVIVCIRSTLIAFWRRPVMGVRYFDLDVCGAGCWPAVNFVCSGVARFFIALIMARGPGVAIEMADRLRRIFGPDLSAARTETLFSSDFSPSDPDAMMLRCSSVR